MNKVKQFATPKKKCFKPNKGKTYEILFLSDDIVDVYNKKYDKTEYKVSIKMTNINGAKFDRDFLWFMPEYFYQLIKKYETKGLLLKLKRNKLDNHLRYMGSKVLKGKLK